MKLILLVMAFGLSAAVCAHPVERVSLEQVKADISKSDAGHPRLFAKAEDFEALRKLEKDDGIFRAALAALRKEADKDCTASPLKREFDVSKKRLLGVARTALKRIFDCAMMYRLTAETKFRDCALRTADEIISFTDWNPSHFLDTAEFTLAAAVTYDWLYDELGTERRKRMEETIVRLGLTPSFANKGNGWIKSDNNWSSVCHAGMMAGALALRDVDPELSAKVVHRAVVNLWRPMMVLAPNGGYPEGPVYWQYGIGFHVIAMDLLERALGTSYGLADEKGWKETADYLDIMTGPTGRFFNYSDCSAERFAINATWWFARRYNRPDILLSHERELLLHQGPDGKRLFALSLLWYTPVPAETKSKVPLVWEAKGSMPVIVQRSGTDKDAFFVAIKGGRPSTNHGHMDGGSFVMDADGVRWAHDLGGQSYSPLEKRGISLWNMRQSGGRWTVYRLNNFSHNTLVIDGAPQQVSGFAKAELDGNTAKIELTPLYTAAQSVVRTGRLEADGRSYVMRDSVKGLKPGTPVRWAMMTRAKVSGQDGATIRLEEKGRTLRLEQLGGVWEWKTEENPRPNEWDEPNPGFRQLTFTVIVPESGDVDFGVRFLR
ncbi:MAG: heparinase II/III family protein [Kiritimatiellae bacterium]|nr:heparinase II/III family protein [Kiritimatiellia bacterium]